MGQVINVRSLFKRKQIENERARRHPDWERRLKLWKILTGEQPLKRKGQEIPS